MAKWHLILSNGFGRVHKCDRRTDGRTDVRKAQYGNTSHNTYHLFSTIISPHQCHHHHSYHPSPHHSSIPNSKLSYFSNPTLHRYLAPLRTDFTDTRTALRLFFLCFGFFSSFQFSVAEVKFRWDFSLRQRLRKQKISVLTLVLVSLTKLWS